MSSYVQPEYAPRLPQAESSGRAVRLSARGLGRRFDASRAMEAMLLAAIVSAVLVVAAQWLDTWADGHLMTAWIALWVVGFTALALLAGTVRRFSVRVFGALDGWAARKAQSRADARLWSIALKDARLMADLQSALARDDAAAISPVVGPRARAYSVTSQASPMPDL